MARLFMACEFESETNHSKDRVKLYSGRVTPYILCGFHATYCAKEFFRWYHAREETK